MSEIDVSKYFKVFDDGCEYFMEDMVDELYEDIVNQNKQLHKLKQENKKLKEIKNISNTYKGIKEMDEITKIINRRSKQCTK